MVTGDLFHRVAPYEVGGSGATFSPDRHYRYRLWRVWGVPENRCVFVGLNPSFADETDNDQTIKKEIGFAKRWGFGALDKVNLFALVSTNPLGLVHCPDPEGPENASTIAETLAGAKRIVWAWGAHDARVMKIVTRALAGRIYVPKNCESGHLGLTRDGHPRHPSRISYSTPFQVGGVP
jgi:hypothetical protein